MSNIGVFFKMSKKNKGNSKFSEEENSVENTSFISEGGLEEDDEEWTDEWEDLYEENFMQNRKAKLRRLEKRNFKEA